jgi:dsDNA-specific endonuclease/ATPase MutS2
LTEVAGNRHIGIPKGRRAVREIDLHLRSGHASFDALERQLARFRGELNRSVRAGEEEVIFIHGGGSGKLRDAIHEIVGSEYPGCSCHDAPFIRYGFNGATVVVIKK